MIIKSIAKHWRKRFAQDLPPSYDLEYGMGEAQNNIRNWLHLYSVYPNDTAFAGALQTILRPGRHTAEEMQAIVPTLIAGPTIHSPQAKAGWKNKVAPYLVALKALLQKAE